MNEEYNLKMWQVLRLLENRNTDRLKLEKHDGNRYVIVDGMIVSKEKPNNPLIIDLNDKWKLIS
jgi:hypothetical protein